MAKGQEPCEMYREAPQLLLWQVTEVVILAQKSGGLSNYLCYNVGEKNPRPWKEHKGEDKERPL